MQPIRLALSAALLAAMQSAAAGQAPTRPDPAPVPSVGRAPAAGPARPPRQRMAPRYFELVNASHDSVEAVGIAPAASGAFEGVDIGGPLRGGTTSVMLDVPAGGCLRDLRVRFRNGRTLLYPAMDLCRASGLRLSARDVRRTSEPPALSSHGDTGPG